MFFDQSLSHFPVLSSSAFHETTSFSQVHPQLSCFVYMYLYDLQHLTGTAYMSVHKEVIYQTRAMFNRCINDYDSLSLIKFLHSVSPFFLVVLWALERVSKLLEGRHNILYSSVLHISWASSGTITLITSILRMLNIFEALLQSLCKI